MSKAIEAASIDDHAALVQAIQEAEATATHCIYDNERRVALSASAWAKVKQLAGITAQ